MRNRKQFPGLHDDTQLRTMGAALNRAVGVMIEMGAVNESAAASYRSHVARVVVNVSRQGLFDEDELTQHVLEALIKPPVDYDRGLRTMREKPSITRRRLQGSGNAPENR